MKPFSRPFSVRLSFLAACFCVGIAQAVPKEADLLRSGQQALAARQWDKAGEAYARAQEANPRSIAALHGLAAVAQGQGNRQQARDWMEKAIEVAPGDVDNIRAYFRLLVEQGARGSAEDLLRKAAVRLPGATDLKLDLGNFYLQDATRITDAARLFRALASESPQLAAGHLGLARALLAQEKPDEAAAAAAEAVRVAPNDAALHQLAASVDLQRKNFEAALAGFTRAVTLRPDLVEGHLGRGDVLIHLRQWPAAVAAFDRANQLSTGNSLAYARRGWALEQSGRLDLATASYREALRIDRNNDEAANLLASVLIDQPGKTNEAVSLARQAIRLKPTKAVYRETLGRALARLGDTHGAIAAYEMAFSIDPTNPAPRDAARRLNNPGASHAQAAAKPSAPAVQVMPTSVAAAVPARPVEANGTVVVVRLDEWRRAWQAKDVERYLAFYARDMEPASHPTRAAWEADRRRKLAKPGPIEVDTDTPKIEVRGERVQTTFAQRYRSGNYRDDVVKRLEWAKEEGAWKIVREEQVGN